MNSNKIKFAVDNLRLIILQRNRNRETGFSAHNIPTKMKYCNRLDGESEMRIQHSSIKPKDRKYIICNNIQFNIIHIIKNKI